MLTYLRLVNKLDEFKNGEHYKIAYSLYVKKIQGNIDIIHKCPKCGCEVWEYRTHTGKGKLPPEQSKWKCTECGQWFICNIKQITKLIGS